MTETGFKYFLQFMQERNAPPKPKLPKIAPPKRTRLTRHDFLATYQPPPPMPVEDYTGSICLLHSLTELFPTYFEVLVDAEDLERLSEHRWKLVRPGRGRDIRVSDTKGKFL